jgi:hypothetical protein
MMRWRANGATLAGAKFAGAKAREPPDCLGPGFRVASGATTDMGTCSGPAGCAAYDPEET